MRIPATILLVFVLSPMSAPAATLDERPAASGEWGFRPGEGSVSEVNPPGFCWRLQPDLIRWDVECGRGEGFDAIEYRAEGVAMCVHCPPRVFGPGKYSWRYRGIDAEGRKTDWSRPRKFTIAPDAVTMPMPPRAELLSRIPKGHPRLFVRPEDLPKLRELARGELRGKFAAFVAQCDRLVANPPPTAEPPKYGPNVKWKDEKWRNIWWGNRLYTIAALDGAATLAFTRLLGGKEEYGQLARRILMDCAKWDPLGSTGYRYNDEAGMPYAHYFARTYTFVNDLLSEDERAACRRVMEVRGREMYRHLYPAHLWRPYESHRNRAWHFLGEVGIAFHDEIDAADDWTWLATNVFFNVYPVWSDDDGGWHEGSNYWASYISRFTWWADVMRSALGINAYNKPYFARAGYYAMYLMPPGTVGGGFGDLVAERRASDNVPLMSQLAAQSGSSHWQWYVEQMGGPSDVGGYVGFVRGMLPKVEPKPPADLPTSQVFRGTGQAYLNTTLEKADRNVQVVFKSSPMGTQSHGYEANNSFLLGAYGQRLLIYSGYRDIYGSEHHARWMWSTRSVNNITVGGQGQGSHTPWAIGRIVDFSTSPKLDIVVGEAGDAYRASEKYPSALERFTRAIVFVKPELVIVFDRLVAREASTFEYWLHAVNRFAVTEQRDIRLEMKDVGCRISFLAPPGLTFSQTDQYDPNPRPRVTLREWHLTATTPAKTKSVEFVTVYRPHRLGQAVPDRAELQKRDGGYRLDAALADGTLRVLLPTDDAATPQGKIVVDRQ